MKKRRKLNFILIFLVILGYIPNIYAADSTNLYNSAISNNTNIKIIVLLLPVICLICSVILWYKYGKEEKIPKAIEFYPPEGFNSLEVGFLYKGKADKLDLASLLIYLGNHGYIKIAKTIEKSAHNHKEYIVKVTKLKDYDGNNTIEKKLLESLIRHGRSDDDNVVTSDDLYNRYHFQANNILDNMINCKENKESIFKKVQWQKFAIILMIIISYLAIIILPITESKDSSLILMFSTISFIFFSFCLFEFIRRVYIYGFRIKDLIEDLSAIFLFIPISIPWILFFIQHLMPNVFYLCNYVIGMICIIGMTLCFFYLRRRTEYGKQLFRKIVGLRNFILTADKVKLETLVAQNPNYFYDILPYAYSFGLASKWIDKFENIPITAPCWYGSLKEFSFDTFRQFFHYSMSVLEYNMMFKHIENDNIN